MNTNRKPDRRAERSKQAILDATRELLAEEGGVRALTVESVAARAGVAKTTIYRRWRDKWELALDAAMIDILFNFAEPVDVGDTRKELLRFVDGSIKSLGSKLYGRTMQGLASEIASDPQLGRVYQEHVVEPRRQQLRQVIDRGIERGDLRPDTDLRLVHELINGAIYYRLLFSGPPIGRKLGERLVDAVLDAYRAPPRHRSAKRPRRSES
jgi:AcrR family transcriptional regulator